MPRVPVHNVGVLGIVKDTPDHLLPPEAWSDGQNVRFQDGKVVKFLGHDQVFGTPSGDPYWAMFLPTSSTQYWIYASLTKLFSYADPTHTDITRTVGGDYSTTEVDLWHGGVLGGIPVITNGVDDPQFWTVGGNMADLTNWPAGHVCQAIRPYKNALVAMNIAKSGTNFPHMVRVSHPATPGALPSSWDETDATKDVYENELDDVEAGLIRDGLGLGDIFVIYKDRSTWGLQLVRGRQLYRLFTIFETSGILTKHCVGAISKGRRHVVATGEDFIVHDGQDVQSLLDRRWRRFYSNNLDTDNYDRSFVTINHRQGEAWLCIPEVGETWPSLAIVWSWRENTIGVRDLSDKSFMAPGIVGGTSDSSWNADTAQWDSDTEQWGQQEFTPFSPELLMCDPVNTEFHRADSTNQFDTVSMTSYVERTGLAIVGQDRQGNPKVDFDRRKLVTRIWPKAEGGPLDVRVGSQEVLGGAVTWGDAQSFNPGVDEYLDFIANGRLLAVRFESSGDVSWKLHGYDLEVELLGVH